MTVPKMSSGLTQTTKMRCLTWLLPIGILGFPNHLLRQLLRFSQLRYLQLQCTPPPSPMDDTRSIDAWVKAARRESTWPTIPFWTGT